MRRHIPSASEHSDVENIPTRGNRTLLKDKSDRDQSTDGYDFVKGSSDMATPRPRMEIFVLLKPFRHPILEFSNKTCLSYRSFYIPAQAFFQISVWIIVPEALDFHRILVELKQKWDDKGRLCQGEGVCSGN